jgi:hypothetical protein
VPDPKPALTVRLEVTDERGNVFAGEAEVLRERLVKVVDEMARGAADYLEKIDAGEVPAEERKQKAERHFAGALSRALEHGRRVRDAGIESPMDREPHPGERTRANSLAITAAEEARLWAEEDCRRKRLDVPPRRPIRR